MNKLLRILAVLAIFSLLGGLGWMLMQIASPPVDDATRLAVLSVTVSPAEIEPGSSVNIRCLIRNPYSEPLYINDPPQALFYLRQQGQRIILGQYFEEEILKNPQRNPLMKHGAVPHAATLAAGTELERSFRLATTPLQEGTFEVVVTLGCSSKPRSHYLVEGAEYELPELVDRFLEWQQRAESPPVQLILTKNPSATASSTPDQSHDQNSPAATMPMDTEAVQFAALSAMVTEAVTARSAGRLAEAEEMLLRAQSLATARLKPLHPVHAIIHGNLGILYTVAGKPQEAESHFTRAQRVALHAFGPQHPETARTSLNLAGFLLSQERTDEAVLLLDGTMEALGDLDTRGVELDNLYNAAKTALEKLKPGL